MENFLNPINKNPIGWHRGSLAPLIVAACSLYASNVLGTYCLSYNLGFIDGREPEFICMNNVNEPPDSKGLVSSYRDPAAAISKPPATISGNATIGFKLALEDKITLEESLSYSKLSI